eukprot:UN06181
MRKSFTLLQSAALMKAPDEYISFGDVLTVAVGVPPDVIHDHFFKSCLSKSFNDFNDTVPFLICGGFPVSLILPKFLEGIFVNNEFFENLAKAEIALKIAEADKKLVDGASEFFPFLGVFGCVQKNFTRGNRNNN